MGFGDYEVTVTLGDCSSTSSVAITKDTTPLTFTLGGPYEVCNPELATIVLTPTNFDGSLASYAWTLDGDPVGEDSPQLQATGFGIYEVTVTIGECTSTSSVEVKENTSGFDVAYEAGCDGTNFVISAEPTVDANGVPSFDPNGASYSWTGPNGFSSSEASSIITDEGVYTVTVTTAEGCVSQASLTAESTTCLIPNGISPNGDGKNDIFDLTGFNVAKLSIFNRYGREVYSKTEYTDEWHGQEDGGNELPTGTYYYMIERNYGETKTGWVYINRQEN
jgi:gliding motility-associated-like protein